MRAAKTIVILCFTIFLLTGRLLAQDKLGGRIFENKTRISLAGIKVENLKSHVIVVSDAKGEFSIKATVGDNICFSGSAYKPDTLYVANLKYLEVFLDLQQNMLKEVKVVTQEIKTGSLSAPAQTGLFNSHTVLYQTDANGNPIGGIKIMVPDWNKDARKKKRDLQIAADEQTKQQIAKVFGPENIQKYLPLKGQELANFIILYIPDVGTYNSTGFNLTLYLNSSYEEFLKMPIEQRQSPTYFQLTK
jgi:hypothetical protein